MKKAFINNKKSILIFITLLLTSTLLFADSTYVVQKGDTLYSISKKYQITVAELRAANNLSENDVLKANQKLIIPSADITNAVALSTDTKNRVVDYSIKTEEHIVEKGETLYRIAKNNGITVAELLAINNLDSDSVIKVGQKLKIKADSRKDVPTPGSDFKAETKKEVQVSQKTETVISPAPDTRTYGATTQADSSTVWPVKNPKVTPVKGKVSGVQLSAKENELVKSVRAGTVMYVGIYRGFGQVLFVQSKTGLIYAYTGMGSVKVHKGDYVDFGDELGTAGVDSITGKPQITFMVFQNGQPVDPAKAPRN